MPTNPSAGNPQILSMQKMINDQYGAGLREDGWCSLKLKQMIADMFRREGGMLYTFRMGDQSNLVYLLQAALYLSGYNLNLNGIYDAATQAAARAFQRAAGFAEDGVLTPDMLLQLFPDAMQPMPVQAPPAMPRTAAQPAPPFVQPMSAAAAMPAAMPRTAPMPRTAAMPAAMPAATAGTAAMPAAQPMNASALAAPARPVPLPAPAPTRPVPLPAPAPNRPIPSRPPQRPEEYTIRLNARNPEAIINVRYDR